MFLEQTNSFQDSLAVMASKIDHKLDRAVFERVIQASQGVLTGVQCDEDCFRFAIHQESYGVLELTIYKEILFSSQDSLYLNYSIKGVEVRGYLDDDIDDFLMLDLVLRVDELRAAPLNELQQLSMVLGNSVHIITEDKGV